MVGHTLKVLPSLKQSAWCDRDQIKQGPNHSSLSAILSLTRSLPWKLLHRNLLLIGSHNPKAQRDLDRRHKGMKEYKTFFFFY